MTRLCSYAREENCGLCFKATKDSWEELPYSWLGVNSSDVFLEYLEALFLWCIILGNEEIIASKHCQKAITLLYQMHIYSLQSL